MNSTNTTPQDFLSALVPEGFINCRAIDYYEKNAKKKLRAEDFFPAGDYGRIQQFIRQYGDVEIYFGVVSRWIRNGKTEGCGNAFAIFADIDFKHSSETEARRRLAAFPLKPSIVVWSGGGLHVYWLLQAPYDIRNGSAEQFKSVLRRVAIVLKADLACSEPAHILRIPETVNHKYPDARTVTVEVWELDRRYTLDGFDFLPPEPKPEPKPKAKTVSTSGALYLSDDEILAKLRKAKNSAKFSRLFDRGDFTGGYKSQSEADDALCCIFAFYTQDESQMDRLFQKSALYRDKWTERDGYYAKRTIQHALDRTTERYDPNRNGRGSWNAGKNPAEVDESPTNESEPTSDTDGTPDEARDGPRPTRYSDDALADLFSARHERDFVYVNEWGWARWTGQRWQRIPDVIVMGHARQTCRQQSELCKEDPDISGKARAGLARALASAKVVAAVVRLAATDPRHYREVSQFDTNLWLFNTPGGTINLKTGELRPHCREDLITKIANATPQGECPKWLAFLDRVTNRNSELQNYLQRLAGYAMCGDPSEECLDFFYGAGGNGKGTFLKALQHGFGEYSTTAQTETFLEAKGERHPTDIAKLAGARLVVAQEVDEGQHWNEVRLKTLTGRDEMAARFMRRDLFDFTPQFTLIISGNNKPALKSVDDAWRRRFHLVPFDVCIPKTEQNPELKTELQAEADGILKWCLAGCLAWQKQRLDPPEAVLSATAEYLEAEDIFEFWLTECCLRGHEGYEERISWTYTSHRHWKQERGETPPGTKTFSQRMKKHGFSIGKETSGQQRGRVFRGVRLTDDERIIVKAILDAQKRREQGGTESKEDSCA